MRGNFQTQVYRPIKNFYVRMQITRFFKQGYTFIESGHDQVLAAVSPSGKELVFARLNTSEQEQTATISLEKFRSAKPEVRVWRTSQEEDCQALPAVKVRDGVLSYQAPARSLTTFVVTL